MPGISAVSPPISAQFDSRQPLGDAGDDRARLGHLELPRREVVEEEERLGALDDQVVHHHRDEVDADVVVLAGLLRDDQLRPHAVRPRDEHRILVARGREVKEPAKPPIEPITPVRFVDLASGLISSTSSLPASMLTPADA